MEKSPLRSSKHSGLLNHCMKVRTSVALLGSFYFKLAMKVDMPLNKGSKPIYSAFNLHMLCHWYWVFFFFINVANNIYIYIYIYIGREELVSGWTQNIIVMDFHRTLIHKWVKRSIFHSFLLCIESNFCSRPLSLFIFSLSPERHHLSSRLWSCSTQLFVRCNPLNIVMHWLIRCQAYMVRSLLLIKAVIRY